MRKKKEQKKTASPCESQRVRIEFVHPTATSVAIAGSFNDWRPGATPMVGLGDGRWRKEIVLPCGRHEYLLVVDGQWTRDPSASEAVSNPYGGVNSILRVPHPTEGNNDKSFSRTNGGGSQA
jgi:hypothetical protein